MAGLAACSSTGTPAAPRDAAAADGMIEQSLYLESFDGTRIAVTVHRPAVAGKVVNTPLPVIVTQDRSSDSPDQAALMKRYTDAGYVWVSQDRRGTGASFGVQTGFVNQLDAGDAKAVIDWAAGQDFSSGKTVALGCSNQGAWQYLVATMQPESLVAIAPACASPQFYDDGVAINGIPMIGLAERPYAGECARPASGARPEGYVPPPPRPVDADTGGSMLRAAQEEQKCGAAMLGQYWLNMPRDGMNDFAGYRPALQDTAMTHWQEVRESGVAVLQLGGWFDAAIAGQVEGYRAWGGQLVMGPWVHGNRAPRGADLPNSSLDLAAMTIDFFDRHAKGIDGGPEEPGILYYTINAPTGSEWTRAATWPDLPRDALYLTSTGMLADNMPQESGRIALAPGGANWFDGDYAPLHRWWAGNFAATNAGSLLYAGPPLAHATEITGAVTAHLWIAANRPDVDVFAMLQDVAPDGSAAYVTDGRLRASWRQTTDCRFSPASPGTAWHVQPHVQITGSRSL